MDPALEPSGERVEDEEEEEEDEGVNEGAVVNASTDVLLDRFANTHPPTTSALHFSNTTPPLSSELNLTSPPAPTPALTAPPFPLDVHSLNVVLERVSVPVYAVLVVMVGHPPLDRVRLEKRDCLIVTTEVPVRERRGEEIDAGEEEEEGVMVTSVNDTTPPLARQREQARAE